MDAVSDGIENLHTVKSVQSSTWSTSGPKRQVQPQGLPPPVRSPTYIKCQSLVKQPSAQDKSIATVKDFNLGHTIHQVVRSMKYAASDGVRDLADADVWEIITTGYH